MKHPLEIKTAYISSILHQVANYSLILGIIAIAIQIVRYMINTGNNCFANLSILDFSMLMIPLFFKFLIVYASLYALAVIVEATSLTAMTAYKKNLSEASEKKE